jgi:hypothetical protein
MKFQNMLLILLSMLVMPTTSFAHSRPFHHVHQKKVVVKKKPRVVVHTKPTVVLMQEEEEEMIVESYRPSINPTQVGFRVLGAGSSGSKLNISDQENPAVGGIGFYLRTDLDHNLAFELAVDFLGGGDLTYSQSQIPLTVGFIYKFLKDAPVNPYAVIGTGIQFTELSYGDGAYRINMTEVVNHMGLGAEFKLSRTASFTTDFRGTGTWKTVDPALQLGPGCQAAGVCPTTEFIATGDRFNPGYQFMAGFAFRF